MSHQTTHKQTTREAIEPDSDFREYAEQDDHPKELL
jgi:hypothetical protein